MVLAALRRQPVRRQGALAFPLVTCHRPPFFSTFIVCTILSVHDTFSLVFIPRSTCIETVAHPWGVAESVNGHAFGFHHPQRRANRQQCERPNRTLKPLVRRPRQVLVQLDSHASGGYRNNSLVRPFRRERQRGAKVSRLEARKLIHDDLRRFSCRQIVQNDLYRNTGA